MKIAKCGGTVFLVALLAGATSGYGRFYQATTGEKTPAPPSPATVQKAPGKAAPAKEAAPAPAREGAAMVAMKDIHFDFDRYEIRREDAEILKHDFESFRQNPDTRASIEDNCDERGTIEYNLVLGQKKG